ncbi:hypothetical protein LB503_001362 [Fusarium chuoi]|nr:hypothetical protein LB503_001362 [Fusarium chuoi]
MQIIAFISYLAVAAAATDVITARVYNQKNLKGSHEDVHGYGCGNVGSRKKNCKGSSIYVSRDVNDLHLDTVNSVHCVNNPDKS